MLTAERIGVLRNLIRAGRVATLATVSAGEPHAALVTPACMPDLSIILLLSDLSRHTAHLRQTARCALLVTDAATESGNPQLTARASLACDASPVDDPRLTARYLAVHPYAALYAEFSDFHIWRLTIRDAHYVAGFGQAWSIESDRLLPDPTLVASIDACQHSLVDRFNTATLSASGFSPSSSGNDRPWRVLHADIDGCDMTSADGVRRFAWSAPITAAADLADALARLAGPAPGPANVSGAGAGRRSYRSVMSDRESS